MRVIDSNINRGRNKTQKQYEQIMWEKNNFTFIGIVKKIETKSVSVKLIPSISYDDYDMKEGFTKVDITNPLVTCLRVEGLTLQVDDVVVVIFTDLDSRQAILDIRRGRNKQDNFITENKSYHNSNFGIVINKIII
jgi:hypothetical protein